MVQPESATAIACQAKDGFDPDEWVELSMFGDTVLTFRHRCVIEYESALLAEGMTVTEFGEGMMQATERGSSYEVLQ